MSELAMTLVSLFIAGRLWWLITQWADAEDEDA